jgi:hypothetical protein
MTTHLTPSRTPVGVTHQCHGTTEYHGQLLRCEYEVELDGDHLPYPHDVLIEADPVMARMNPGGERMGHHVAWS